MYMEIISCIVCNMVYFPYIGSIIYAQVPQWTSGTINGVLFPLKKGNNNQVNYFIKRKLVT